MRNEKGQFVKGHCEGVRFGAGQKGHCVPHTVGAKQKMSRAHVGVKLSKHHRQQIALGHMQENNPHWAWKGNAVRYGALHEWLYRRLGGARFCTNRLKHGLPFRCSGVSKRYEWANRSRGYKRDLNDWVQLCHSCHVKADKRKLIL